MTSLNFATIAESIREHFTENELDAALQAMNLSYESIVPREMNYEDGSQRLLATLKRKGLLKKVFEGMKAERPDAESFQVLMNDSLKALADQRTTLGDVLPGTLGQERAISVYNALDRTAGFLHRFNNAAIGTVVAVAAIIGAVLAFSDDVLQVKTLDQDSRPIRSVDLVYYLKGDPAPQSALALNPNIDFFPIPLSKLADGIPIALELSSSGPGERAAGTFQVQQLRYETSKWRFWRDANKLYLTIRVRSGGGN